MTDNVKKRDYTSLYIVLIIFGCAGLFIFGLIVEVLKFLALVKWVFA